MSRLQGDLPARTYRFSLTVLALIDDLPDGTKGWVVGRQLLRCATSVGANVCEADGASTDREFAHLCNIARREAMEAHYWLRLCRDSSLLVGNKLEEGITEADELMRILSTVVRKTKHHIVET